MIRPAIWLALASMAFLGISPGGSNAQSRSAVLTGVVLAPDGKPVANAMVTYQSGGGDTPHAVHTDAHGRFSIPKLRRDNYDLRASSHGMYSTWQKNVMVRTGEQKSVTLQLTSGSDLSKTALTQSH
jgi:Carboxypeptidase regulatory-like domain